MRPVPILTQSVFGCKWWAHKDLNLEPTDYESAALTVELWAREAGSSISRAEDRGQGLEVPSKEELPRLALNSSPLAPEN